jgi:hypothetical protein
MVRLELIKFGPYLNETYHGNYVYRGHPLVNRPAEGIVIIYQDNIFDLEEYKTYRVDNDGNPIR